jgi:uncharacterized protein DUF3137
MIDYGEDQFRELCRSGRVQTEIGSIEEKRKSALTRFWLFLLVGIAVAGLVAWDLIASDWFGIGVFAGTLLLVCAIGFALGPLSKVGRDLKLPVLESLAEKGGLTYVARGFDPPVYAEARDILFGKWLSGQSFTDLFQGADADGRRFAIYEGRLTRRSGRSTVVIFTGQIYAFQRRSRTGGQIVVIPDRGIFNFFKPRGGFERVKFENDPAFEQKFEVYATEPHAAAMLLGTDTRARFLQWRQSGRVLAYIGPEDIFVAIPGKDRFEPGSMFRARPGEQRVRQMFDEVCASLATLKSLRESLD